MRKLACKDAAEASCIIANLIAETEQPCGQCDAERVVLTGTAPTGERVTVRILPEHVLEVEGGEELLERIRERRCPHGR